MEPRNRTQILRMVQSRLLRKLNEKTSWGRNELGELIQSTVQEVAFELLDVEENGQ